MNRNAASMVLAVDETVNRVRRGASPFETEQLASVSVEFSEKVSQSVFLREVESMFKRGEDPLEFVTTYVGVVFAQGFSAGTRFSEEISR